MKRLAVKTFAAAITVALLSTSSISQAQHRGGGGGWSGHAGAADRLPPREDGSDAPSRIQIDAILTVGCRDSHKADGIRGRLFGRQKC